MTFVVVASRFLLISMGSGVVARLVYPRLTRMGWLGTVVLGGTSSLLGGLIWSIVGVEKSWHTAGILSSTLVALVLLCTRKFDLTRRPIQDEAQGGWPRWCL